MHVSNLKADRHRKSGLTQSPVSSFKSQYFDLRPPGYAKKSYESNKNSLYFSGSFLRDEAPKKSRKENDSQNKTSFASSGRSTQKAINKKMDFAKMVMADEGELAKSDLAGRRKKHKKPITDYEEFLSQIESVDNSYQWSRLAEEILKRSDRSADFIGHKIEHISLKNSRSRSGRRRKGGQKEYMPSLLNKYFSFNPDKITSREALRNRKKSKVHLHERNSIEFSATKMTFDIIDPTTSVKVASTLTEANSQIFYSKGHRRRDFSNKGTKGPSLRYKRQTKEEDLTSWGSEQHRIECWASNEVGASTQPCIFLVSKVGECKHSLVSITNNFVNILK